MKKGFIVMVLSMIAVVGLPTMASASTPEKIGQKIFKKKFRKKCGFSGVRFARNHTQGEWEEIYDNDTFPEEAKKICPRLKLNKIKPSWWKPVYEFSYTYAKDGKVPKC